jgi:hypothetical protein
MIIEQIKYDPSNPFRPFIFIGEKLAPTFAIPYQIGGIAVLKRADAHQVQAIKSIVKPDKLLSILRQGDRETNIYEHNLIKTPMPHGDSFSLVPLKEVDYQYWIIELSGEFLGDYSLIQAIFLLSTKLTVLASIGEIGQHFHKALLAAVFYTDVTLLHKPPTSISEDDMGELIEIYERLKTFRASTFHSSYIGKALKDYENILDIEWSNPFKIISIFSIIESLLTSNQKNTDSSINKQLQKKIKLLNNQFHRKIDFSAYFKGPDTLTEENIIEKLYAYRSKIAHGDYYDFNKELQVLSDHEIVLDFLTILVKRILLYAMQFPQLVVDLKEC